MNAQPTLASHAADILRTLGDQTRWLEPGVVAFLDRLQRMPDIPIKSARDAT